MFVELRMCNPIFNIKIVYTHGIYTYRNSTKGYGNFSALKNPTKRYYIEI